jgi:flagellar biosynthesis GTPase FlhF
VTRSSKRTKLPKLRRGHQKKSKKAKKKKKKKKTNQQKKKNNEKKQRKKNKKTKKKKKKKKKQQQTKQNKLNKAKKKKQAGPHTGIWRMVDQRYSYLPIPQIRDAPVVRVEPAARLARPKHMHAVVHHHAIPEPRQRAGDKPARARGQRCIHRLRTRTGVKLPPVSPPKHENRRQIKKIEKKM